VEGEGQERVDGRADRRAGRGRRRQGRRPGGRLRGPGRPRFTGWHRVDGSRKLFELLTPALQTKDAALVGGVEAGFAAVDKSLAAYARPGGGFASYTALAAADRTQLQAELAGLSEQLARIPGVLGLKG